MKCKKCGEQLADEYIFCTKCGHKIVRASRKKRILTIALIVLVTLVLGMGGYFLIYPKLSQPTLAIEDNSMESEEVETVTNTGFEEQVNLEEETETITEAPEKNEMQEFFLALSFEPIEMTMGETHEIRLEKKMTDAEWVSSDEKIVQVANGKINAITPGTATITVSLGEDQKFFDVDVKAFSNMTLAVNCSKTMKLNDAISNVRWESDAPEIVHVDNGNICALSNGVSVVTAYINEEPYSFEVVATTPDISTTSIRKIIGNTQQVSILGTNGHVEWKSDNTAIATVSETGLVTAEPTGAGQSTVVHAYVDGMEFKIDVAVEPIPQLSSTYKIHGYQDNYKYKNARITLCANANEIVKLVEGNGVNGSTVRGGGIIEVLNVADEDYSDGMTYPVYRTFDNVDKPYESYTEIYLIGTSQKADVLLQNINPNGSLGNSRGTIIYEEKDGYGVIKIYSVVSNESFVTISIDGYTYEIVLAPLRLDGTYYDYSYVDRIPINYVIEECSVDEVITHQETDYSAIRASSATYHTNTDWGERIGTKFVEALEDQAIEIAAAAVLKIILPF